MSVEYDLIPSGREGSFLSQSPVAHRNRALSTPLSQLPFATVEPTISVPATRIVLRVAGDYLAQDGTLEDLEVCVYQAPSGRSKMEVSGYAVTRQRHGTSGSP
jgi:hypothetical protein